MAEFHKNPYDIDNKITFAEIYAKWSAEKFPTTSKSNMYCYKSSYALCADLYDMPFIEIRKSHLQGVIDNSGKNYPMLKKVKVLFGQLYQYALENDVCTKDYSEFVDVAKFKQKNKEEMHTPFTEAEITKLWEMADENEHIKIVLMLIYSGVRVSELLNLKKENVHLKEQYFDVIESKTENGIRKVPIANKVLKFWEYWFNKNDCKYLLSTVDGKHFTYNNYKPRYWDILLNQLQMEHTPHDTRHTCVSLLAKADVNQTIIKKIVGHSGAMTLTEKVYTHFEIKPLLDAINKI